MPKKGKSGSNKSEPMKTLWDIPEKADFIDPLLRCSLQLGVSGEIETAVSDPDKLFSKLAETVNGIQQGETQDLISSLKAPVQQLIADTVKSDLSTVINGKSIDLLEIDSHLKEISAGLLEALSPHFDEYGLVISRFSVTKITLPEEDPNFKRIREFHTISLMTRIYEVEASLRTESEDEDDEIG